MAAGKVTDKPWLEMPIVYFLPGAGAAELAAGAEVSELAAGAALELLAGAALELLAGAMLELLLGAAESLDEHAANVVMTATALIAAVLNFMFLLLWISTWTWTTVIGGLVC
ncbi:hypothetical protein [Nakamurella antarctica]|uniref:hypothetical protein n=1 Tax=Nakamurella antarctica TaxID=1902245 RepID=UPI0013DE5332|nr:hypothetical protein [Nakamurella antarctica]